jgi:hypothetical protein
VGSNPASKPGHPDDRWMVSFSAYPRESLDDVLPGFEVTVQQLFDSLRLD